LVKGGSRIRLLNEANQVKQLSRPEQVIFSFFCKIDENGSEMRRIGYGVDRMLSQGRDKMMG